MTTPLPTDVTRAQQGLPADNVPEIDATEAGAGLEIPAILRGEQTSGPKPAAAGQTTITRVVTGWAIAGNFAFGVAGMVLLGYAAERFIWPRATPYIMVGCAVVGVLGGGYRFVREGIAANRAFAEAGIGRRD